MTILVFFDAYASAYEIKGEIGGLSGMDGVNTMTLMQKSDGDCITSYCIKLEADATKSESVMQRVRSMASQYSGYASNLKIMAYKPV